MTGEAWTLAEHIARRQGAAAGHLTIEEAVENAKVTFGEAGLCPECGAPGAVEMTNVQSRTTWVICNRCTHRWSHRDVRSTEA